MADPTGFQMAPDWATWAQGGYLPPVDDSNNSGFNSFLQGSSPAVRALLAKNLTTLGPQPKLPPSGASISGTQTPPTLSDYAARPAAALGDFMATPSAGFSGSASAPPPATPQAPPNAPTGGPQPDTYSAAQMASAAPQAAPQPPTLLGDRAEPSEVPGFNFGNIRPVGSSTSFNTYGSAQDGVAAMANQLAINQDQHGLTTLRQQIARWAPVGDGKNDPNAYAQTAGKLTGFDPDAPLNFKDPAVLSKVIPAMAQVEQGKPIGVGSDILTAGIQSGLDTHAKGGSVAAGSAPGLGTQAPPAQATVATNTSNAPPPTGLPGQAPDDVMSLLKSSLYGKDELQLPGGSKLLALAAGILSGHSLGQGLGKGFENMNQMQMADLANKRAINAQTMQLASLGLMNNYRTAQLGLQGNKANGPPFIGKDSQGNDVAMIRLANGEIMPIPGLPASVVNSLHRTDTNVVAGVAAAKAGADDNAAAINGLYNDAANASIQNEQIGPLLDNLKSGKVAAGPGPINELKRSLSNAFGVDLGSDPTQTQLTEAQASQIRGTQAFPKNMRNMTEFKSVQQGLLNVNLQDPAAMTQLANGVRNVNNLRIGMRDDFITAIKNDPSLRTDPDKYEAWEAQEIAKWRSGLGAQGGLYGSAPSGPPNAAPSGPSNAPAQAPGGTTSSGIKWSLSQ